MNILDIFLALNALVLGIVVTLAVQYFRAHKESSKPAVKPSQPAPVPAAVRERIAKQAESDYQGIVNRSALQLQHDLAGTGDQLSKLLEKFGAEVLDDEMRLFRENVAEIRASTQGSLSGAEAQITQQQTAILESLAKRQADLEAKFAARQTELEAGLEQSYKVRSEELTKELNDKLNDAVLAFLLETLGHEVDLGAQADYLVATLEAHKAELIGTAAPSTTTAQGPKQ